jgi:hypothetical protein
MGWASGSSLFIAVIKAAKRYIKDDKARRKFYLAILPEFNDHDWDTHQECEGQDIVFDRILREQGYVEDENGEPIKVEVYEDRED